MSEVRPPPRVSFGDNVRIRSTPFTVERGVAGLHGHVYGSTTPSASGVDVIGELRADFAVNVHLPDKNEAHWFAEELVELLDHAPGTEIRLAGIAKKWIRRADGTWAEESIDAPDQRDGGAE